MTSFWEKLKKQILDTDLYTHSGTEVGVSNGTLILKQKDGDFFIEKNTDSDIPEICQLASSDLETNYPELNKQIFGQIPNNWLIGNYKKIYVGYFNNEEVRKNGSSGGIISGTQLYLLEKNKIDGAITLKMREDIPYLAEPIVATTKQEILSGAQSKYTIAPVNQILSNLPGKYSSLAYVGLPNQVASIRKLQAAGHQSVSNINYILGIFHGETIGFSSIKSVLRANGEKDISQIKSLQFRAGEWPGNLRIELKNGKVISISKFYANYLIPSHITKYSLFQVDYTNELADISVGDAWAPVYENRKQGWSVIIARTQKGLDLIEEMRANEAIVLDEISELDFIKMHSHGLDLKKRGAFIRINKRKKKGLPVPFYGYEPTNISSKRKMFESVLGVIFKIFQAKTTIRILEKLPIELMGWVFIKARNIWKKSTKPTKKSGLTELKFRTIQHGE